MSSDVVSSVSAQALIGFGQVRHTRLRPRRNAFAYPTYFLMLPLRSLRATQIDPMQTLHLPHDRKAAFQC